MWDNTKLSKEVKLYVEKHWARFQRVGDSTAIQTPHSVSAESVMARILSYRFCRQKPQDLESFRRIVSQSIEQNTPIPVILGHGPLKNPNNCTSSQMDWAEFFTLSHLVALNEGVQKLYPPGLRISLYLDDARAEAANLISPNRTEDYISSLRRFVAVAGISAFITEVCSLKDLYTQYAVDQYITQAESMVEIWEHDPKNQAFIQVHLEHAERNMPQGYLLEPKERCALCQDAAHRYRVYYQAEVLSGLWNQPGQLYGRFSPHEGFWQLFTLRKGSVTQPWQGQGCLRLNANGKMEPFLMTRHRSLEYEVLDVFESGLSLEGFEDIDLMIEKSMPVGVGPTKILISPG